MNDALIGHNRPPEDTLVEGTDRLVAVADKWLQERPAIVDDDQAGKAADLIEALTAHERKVETTRKAEKAPHIAAAAAVDEKFKPLLSRLGHAKAIIKGKLGAWLAEKERRKKAELARKEAEALAALQAAEDAKKKAPESVDAMVAAEEAEKRALALVKAADKANQAPVQAKGDYGAKAHGLRSTWKAVLVDQDAAYRTFRDNPEIAELLTRLGNAAVRAGVRDLPGFNVIEQRSVA